jgi:RNA polymerase sigma-70 factor (ECF subfamily)
LPDDRSDVVTATVGEDLLVRLRASDEAAFAELVGSWSPGMLRAARPFVASNAEAEEVVQETWVAVVTGLSGFEGRSSLRTWVFTILANRARTRGVRESRSVPFSSLVAQEISLDEPVVDPSRFARSGGWGTPPRRWEDLPDEALQSRETLDVVREGIAELPPMQQVVVTMRDVDGFSSAEVADALQISAVHERVLLHRARGKLRTKLDEYLA